MRQMRQTTQKLQKHDVMSYQHLTFIQLHIRVSFNKMTAEKQTNKKNAHGTHPVLLYTSHLDCSLTAVMAPRNNS